MRLKKKINKIIKTVGKKITKFRPKILSRHPSHNILRRNLPLLDVRSVIRLGSTTPVSDKTLVQINSIDSIKISSNKRLMKEKFTEANVNTAPWLTANSVEELINNFNDAGIDFPIVGKSLYGSRGIGNTLLKGVEDLRRWAQNKDFSRYIFEKYLSYKLEYRLHVTKNGCFYACRKALKLDASEKERWQRHSDTCVWYLEENENFRRPNSWDDIVTHCVNALNAIGADVLSFDVRVQSEVDAKGRKRDYQNFALIECNSASSMHSENGTSVCANKYMEILPNLILEKSKGN